MHSLSLLPGLVADVDAIVLCTPLTAAARGIFDAALLSRVKDSVLLVNVS